MKRRKELIDTFGPKKMQRVDACLITVRLLSYLRLPFAPCMNAVRCCALSKADYGLVARWATMQLTKRIWAAIHVGSRRAVSATPWLPAALLDGNMHLDILFATKLVGTLAGAR